MVTEIWKIVKYLVEIANNLQKYQIELTEVRRELRDLTIVVHGLAQEIRYSKERADNERLNLLLEVENKLLRFENFLVSKEDKRGRRKEHEPETTFPPVIARQKISRK